MRPPLDSGMNPAPATALAPSANLVSDPVDESICCLFSDQIESFEA